MAVSQTAAEEDDAFDEDDVITLEEECSSNIYEDTSEDASD
jgi:hypothetical protein